jgi:Zn-dependent protease
VGLYGLLMRGDFSLPALAQFAGIILAVIVAITVHEYAHARSAKSYGDNTAEQQGRLTLNPKSHYDPIGSTIFLLFGFGWAKPVPIQPAYMRNPRLDGLKCALWGPFSNILMALALALPIRQFGTDLPLLLFVALQMMVLINLFLAFFNLLPVPPLDGSRVISYLLPQDLANRFDRFMFQWGFIMIIGIVLLVPGLLSATIGRAAFTVMSLFTGLPMR